MKELTLEILEKALKDWRRPIKQCRENSTSMGLCGYFYFQHEIDYYRCHKSETPWAKYTTSGDWVYHFNGDGDTRKGRSERVKAIKGMIKDLEAKQNEDTSKS